MPPQSHDDTHAPASIGNGGQQIVNKLLAHRFIAHEGKQFFKLVDDEDQFSVRVVGQQQFRRPYQPAPDPLSTG